MTGLEAGDLGRLPVATTLDGANDRVVVYDKSTGQLTTATPDTLATYGDDTSSTTIQLAGVSRVGATAGWTITGVDTGFIGTVPASQTASTLIFPISGIPLGATITSFQINGQVESAGNTATLDADMIALTAVAAGSTTASIGAITQVSVTADTLVASSKTVTSTVTSAIVSLYILLTATTAASTDIELNSITVTYTKV